MALVAVLHVNFSVVAFDDCLGDGEAEAGMPAEILALGPDRMEAVEDRLAGFFRNARALVVDADRTSSPTRAAAISTSPPGGEKLTALSMMS